jgi:hypothetical protein
MSTPTPDLTAAIEAVSRHASKRAPTATETEKATLEEVSRRLQRLGVLAAELIVINDAIWASGQSNISFDSDTDTLIFSVEGIEQRLTLKRADPNVPITVRTLDSGAGYSASTSVALDQEALRFALEEKLESYYHSAHRVLKLLGTLPEFVGVRCEAVTRVRNNLVEHPPEGSTYSFGYGSAGPRVKPSRRTALQWVDEGLLSNTSALVNAIVKACKKELGD